MLAVRDRDQLAAMRSELRTLRLDGPCPIPAVLAELGALVDTDAMILYSVGERADGWEISRFSQAGGNPDCERLLKQTVREQGSSLFYYDLARPEAAQRNRVFEARRWLDRMMPGTWEQSAINREVFTPLRMQRYEQWRALLCDGPSLLAWFGALYSGAATRRQKHLFSSLVPAMQQRLKVERQLAAAPRTSSALRHALEQLGNAVFLISTRGTIHEANAAGRALLDTQRSATVTALTDAAMGRASSLSIELVPVHDRGTRTHYLAIAGRADVEVRVKACVDACVTRWELTQRQAEVLALASRGLANATIAATLRVGERTVELHMTAIFDRAGVDSRAALVARVLTSA